MLTKYSKHSKSSGEIEYYYNEAIKNLKSEPKETIAEIKSSKKEKNFNSKLLTRIPVLLAQIKAGNNSYKLKMKSDKYHMFYINTIKSPENFTTI